MMYSHDDRRKSLMATPIDELRKQVVNNVEELNVLADDVDVDESELKDLTQARNILV